MRPFFENFTFFDHVNPMGRPHGAEPVGDDKDRAALADVRHVLLDNGFRFIIQGARRFIEN